MDWTLISTDYLNYLREHEHRVPYSDYGSDKFKPFFGCLLNIDDDIVYIAQVSHARKRHTNLKQSVDFIKIYDPKAPKHVLAVINLNYMFPVPLSEIGEFRYKDIENYRTFSTPQDKSKYIYLMRQELKYINSLTLDKNANEIYENKLRFPDSDLSNRCFDFKELEQYAREYKPKIVV